MRTLLVAKKKGGAGATTLCRELGVCAAAAGRRVCFVDLDPQASLWQWWAQRVEPPLRVDPENPGFAQAVPQALEHTLRAQAARGADLAVVDTPPSEHRWLPAALALADLALLPTRPTTDDFRALASVLEVVEEADRPYLLVPCQVPPGRSRLWDEALPMLAGRGKVAPPLRIRAAFPVEAGSGLAAVEGPPSSPARAEVEALWAFVAAELERLGRRRARARAS